MTEWEKKENKSDSLHNYVVGRISSRWMCLPSGVLKTISKLDSNATYYLYAYACARYFVLSVCRENVFISCMHPTFSLFLRSFKVILARLPKCIYLTSDSFLFFFSVLIRQVELSIWNFNPDLFFIQSCVIKALRYLS